MNKDFWNKPISLKDIDLSKINLKDIKNKKEIIIGILIIIYIVSIFLVGNSLLEKRGEVKAQYISKEQRYESLQRAGSEEALQKKIEDLENEKVKLYSQVTEISNSSEFNEILKDFKKNSPIRWDSEEISLKSETKDLKDYDIYIVSIGNFSGTFEEIEAFLEYVNNYDKIVRIDTINFSRSKITGKLNGQLRMSFYFKKLSV